MSAPQAVDAVVTWVDGNDPAHRARLDAYLAATGRPRPPAAAPTRFDACGELDHCLASLARHAPWFRRVFIVTDGQVPPALARLAGTPLEGRVELVDHRRILAGHEAHLPTFNSRAIITALWRIPGLAERFVYFNDDFMLLRDVAPTDFFRGDALVLRGRWRAQSAYRPSRRIVEALKSLRGRPRPDRAGNHEAQELSARLVGFERRYFRLYHTPFPFHRDAIRAFFDARPDLFEANVSHRLRSSSQFKAESLATHLALAEGKAVIDNRLRVAQIKPGEQAPWRLRAKLRRAAADPACAFVCVQSLDRAGDALQAEILAWLGRHAGVLDAGT